MNDIDCTTEDINRISCTAMFIAEGLHDAGYDAVISSYAKNEQTGWVEAVYEIARYAEIIDAECLAYTRLEFEYIGVFDYEVSSTFGRWYGEQTIKGNRPTHDAAMHWIKGQVKRFFIKAR